MKTFYFSCASLFSFLTVLYAAGSDKMDCLEKEKALGLLEIVEDYLSKANDSFPSCKDDSSSTDESECSGKKSLAYIEISKKLISNVRENFPTCKGSEVIAEVVKERDCSEILASGRTQSGVYTIWPSESNTTGKPLQVYCDMETDNGGWTVIQRRGKYAVQQDFYQDWENYKNGFGKITEEFWLGNENIRVLCIKGCKIRFDLQDKRGKKGFALYQNFHLTGSNYKIYIQDYTGDVGDAMQFQNNSEFSTKGKGNTNKVDRFKGGWWYSFDNLCNPNGIYQPEKSDFSTVYWYKWQTTYGNLGRVEIKVKPK